MSTQTTKQERPATIKEDASMPYAPSTLIEEIIEETKLRGRLGVFDLDRAAEQAQQRVQALKILMHAAIASTKPIHWLLFKNKQGQIFARFNASGAERIAIVFGITVTPKGQPRIVDNHGQRKTAEVFGTATSAVLGLTIDNIRSYRVEGEDFLGRPAEDTTYERGGKPGKTVAGVGDNDWLQSTLTGLISKGVRLLSGLITVSPDELAEVWDIPVERVVATCTMGHGFSTDERAAAGGGTPVSEGLVRRMFGMASGRLKALGQKGNGRDIVSACINRIMGAKASGEVYAAEEVTKEFYERICAMIEKWDPTSNGEGAKAASGPSAAENLATEGQKGMLRDKAAAKAKSLPKDSGIDSGAILHECIIEACGSDAGIDGVTQDQLPAIVTKINAWGKS